MDVALQIILFFLLVGEGALLRVLYAAVLVLQKKIGGKPFAVITDVLTAVIGSGVMLLTCLILADSVRVFYAVFFIGGILVAHMFIRMFKNKSAKKKEKTK